jgi:rhodanese-related sulfurtransferase
MQNASGRADPVTQSAGTEVPAPHTTSRSLRPHPPGTAGARCTLVEVPQSNVRHVSVAEAERLVSAGETLVLDVRTRDEYEQRGHIPGAWLLPLDLIVAAPAVLPSHGRPVLVVCEHGVRSQRAATMLGEVGVAALNLVGGMAAWTGARTFEPGEVRGPSDWLLANADLLPNGGTALDVACGRGRHALLLASAGFRVRAIDADASRIEVLRTLADRWHLDVDAAVQDLEHGAPAVAGTFDLVVVFNYLHRPLMPAIVGAVAPGGVLFYETFTVDQAARGRPTSPAHLLQHGELPQLVAPLTVVRTRDGEVSGRLIAGIVARRDR